MFIVVDRTGLLQLNRKTNMENGNREKKVPTTNIKTENVRDIRNEREEEKKWINKKSQ